jgi:hypothetical protein
MQPSFTGYVVASGIDRFIEHMRVTASEAEHLLLQPMTYLSRQILMASIPQLIAMRHRTRHPRAGCFNNVFAHVFGIRRRKVAMPVDDFRICSGTRLNTLIKWCGRGLQPVPRFIIPYPESLELTALLVLSVFNHGLSRPGTLHGRLVCAPSFFPGGSQRVDNQWCCEPPE